MRLSNDINNQKERDAFENAYRKMEKEGIKSIMFSDQLIKKRSIIRDKMISYYEITEEFEKCKFVKDFFDKIDLEIKASSISEIVSRLKEGDKES